MNRDVALSRWGLPAVILFAITVLLINPIGFVGGGNDDQRYVDAARCWVAANGPCLATNHWESRWPTVAPIALAFALFGESRNILGLAPLAWWIAGLMLIGLLGQLWFDRPTGLVAAAVMASVVVYTAAALQPGADNVELALQLGALALATIAYRRQSRGWALAAGAVAGIALQARDTSLVFVGLSALGWLLLDRERRRVLLWSVVGLVAATAVEMAAYAAATGDPLYRYRLALGHGQIWSAELAPWVDTSRSPLFNPQFIAGWRRSMGIELWWPIDPWLNMLTSPMIAIPIVLAAVLGFWGWRFLPPQWRGRLVRLTGLALLATVILIYALAIDPKPRIFLPLAAAASLTFGALVVSCWRAKRREVPVTALVVALSLGAVTIASVQNIRKFEATARTWIARDGDRIEIDAPTRSILTLVPEARLLPADGSGRPLRLTAAPFGCRQLIAPRADARPAARIIATEGSEDEAQLCLLEYEADRARRSPAASGSISRR